MSVLGKIDSRNRLILGLAAPLGQHSLNILLILISANDNGKLEKLYAYEKFLVDNSEMAIAAKLVSF